MQNGSRAWSPALDAEGLAREAAGQPAGSDQHWAYACDGGAPDLPSRSGR